MTTQTKKINSKTYLPSTSSSDAISTFLKQIEQFANKQARLTSADGTEVLLPDPLFDVLRRVADALASGNGVTVMPRDARLTTQQAADVLGISRPTLIKLLEAGAMPFETVGRHRRLMLGDIETYRDSAVAERRAVIQRAGREGQADGLLDLSHSDMPTRK